MLVVHQRDQKDKRIHIVPSTQSEDVVVILLSDLICSHLPNLVVVEYLIVATVQIQSMFGDSNSSALQEEVLDFTDHIYHSWINWVSLL